MVLRRRAVVVALCALITMAQSVSTIVEADVSGKTLSNGVLTATQYVGLYDENAATFWSRSSGKLYLTVNNSSGSVGSVQPGDNVVVDLADNRGILTDDPQKTAWYCDSPNVTWTTLSNTQAFFQASKPGIYTIQVKTGKEYSVPMVLVVGYAKLKSAPISMPPSSSGVMPLPEHLTQEPKSIANAWESHMTASAWAAQGSWIPVSGHTNTPAKSMYVEIYSPQTATNWDYEIPVNKNRQFGALLRSPSHGTVRVILIPDYFKTSNQQTHGVYGRSITPVATATYVVTVSGLAPTITEQSIWASAWFDYNMSAEFNSIASTLVENSPSLETAMEAICNWVSTEITYNNAEYDNNLLFQQDAMKTLDISTGMCMDFSDVEAALLNSVGIPTQILGGQAGHPGAFAGHVWTQVWNGATWEPVDTTFDAAQGLSNAWFGATSMFQQSHKLYSGEVQAYLPTPSWG